MPIRRMWVLVKGLPPESATWRKDAFPPVVEFLATLVERQDAWSRILAMPFTKQGNHPVPPPVEILRPGQEPERKQVTTDPREVAAFFRSHFSDGPAERR